MRTVIGMTTIPCSLMNEAGRSQAESTTIPMRIGPSQASCTRSGVNPIAESGGLRLPEAGCSALAQDPHRQLPDLRQGALAQQSGVLEHRQHELVAVVAPEQAAVHL